METSLFIIFAIAIGSSLFCILLCGILTKYAKEIPLTFGIPKAISLAQYATYILVAVLLLLPVSGDFRIARWIIAVLATILATISATIAHKEGHTKLKIFLILITVGVPLSESLLYFATTSNLIE